MNKRMIFVAALATAGMMAAGGVQAERWCPGGTVVTVADVVWIHSDMLAHTQGMIPPPNTINPEAWMAYQAGSNYCQGFAGGGNAGPIWVPGAGTVTFEPYGPQSLISMYSYQLQHGLWFECKKCYAIPPLEPVPVGPRL